ncbi:hypothetical protein HK097_006966 [Rhizophlyctis rosea]|uniref:Uncharacterized protein n=1 Tax=Rhizophlyctis rosea TaxID=64517 RepID=A0AAD5SC99_9FUNG|nr:hypothetical protein HK097_006966 [Rhizophlyctis rosea]
MCCGDPLMGATSAYYTEGATNTITGNNKVLRTGVLGTDFRTLLSHFASSTPPYMIRLTSVGALEEGTARLHSKGFRFWFILRVVISAAMTCWQAYTMFWVRRVEGFEKWRMNLKWGMIWGNFAWSVREY